MYLQIVHSKQPFYTTIAKRKLVRPIDEPLTNNELRKPKSKYEHIEFESGWLFFMENKLLSRDIRQCLKLIYQNIVILKSKRRILTSILKMG